MRRAAIIATCLAAVLSLAPPAMATNGVRVIKGFFIDDSTRSWPGLDQTPCGGTNVFGANRGAYLTITGAKPTPGQEYFPLDSKMPGATRSWQMNYATYPTETDAYGPQFNVSTASQLQTFKIDIDGGSANMGQATVYAWYQNNFWAGKASVTSMPPGWSTVDASSADYTWYEYSNSASPTSQTPISGSSDSTIAAFEAAHGVPPHGYSAAIGFGCDNEGFAFQNLQFGAPGSVTTYKFSSLTDRLTIRRSVARVLPGHAVRISGGSKYGYVAWMHLQARRAGTARWATITTVRVGAPHCAFSGTGTARRFLCWSPFSAVVHPKVATYYRWVESGNAATDPGASGSTFVGMR